MNFETFFNHKFLQRPEPPISQSPLQTVDLPLPNIYGSPPSSLPRVTPLRTTTPIKIAQTPPASQPESPRSARAALSSSPEDDYVLVPANLPTSDQSSESFGDKM